MTDSRVDDTTLEGIFELLEVLGEDKIDEVLDGLPDHVVEKFWRQISTDKEVDDSRPAPANPLLQAQELDSRYRSRPHLEYLAARLSQAIEDVENGIDRWVVISMPPRSGKSQLSSVYLPAWILRKHPDWKIGLISHSPSLAVSWGRTIRTLIKENWEKLRVRIAPDSSAVQEWETTEKGVVVSRSVGQSITGLGFKVFIVDDAVKDFADAHSEVKRQALWDWWVANAYTRLEPPSLVIVIGTRWHEDDIIGRLLSSEYDGDPTDWEVIKFPAIAEEHDVLGREPGEPLLSPLLEETREQALARWEKVKRAIGTYAWSALYQQRPAPSKGAIFDTDWWRFWTHHEALASKDEEGNPDPKGSIVWLDPDDLKRGRWLDSWDMAFKATSDSDFVVGQRWMMLGVNRFLIYQTRARRTFTQTLAKMKEWANTFSHEAPHSHLVHERLVEDKANGTAIIDTLKETIAGLIPINPTESKEARARAVTPEVESGNVLLPLPSEPGNEWVTDFLSEFRDFPTGAHDDQVDAGTQALSRLRTPTRSSVTVPGRVAQLAGRGRAHAAQTQRRIGRAGSR